MKQKILPFEYMDYHQDMFDTISETPESQLICIQSIIHRQYLLRPPNSVDYMYLKVEILT